MRHHGSSPGSVFQSKRFVCGKPRGAMRPAEARAPIQSASSAAVTVRVRPAGSFQREALGEREGHRVRQAAVLVLLQPHALAARPSPAARPAGRPASLRFSPTTATWSPATRRQTRARRPVAEVQHLPAGAGLGQRLVLRAARSRRPRRRRPAAAPPGRCTMQRQRLRLVRQVDQQPHRLAHAAPAGQRRAGEREHPPVRGHQQQLVGGLGVQEERRPVAVLELQLGVRRRDGPSSRGSSPSPSRPR